MPLSRIQLEQTEHLGGSGTLVSDEELVDASGFLQSQIPDVLSDLDDVVLSSPVEGEVLTFNEITGNWENAPPSGGGADVIEIINENISFIASGVINEIDFRLPIAGDDNDFNITTVGDVPVAEQDEDQAGSWNLITPTQGASGVRLTVAWAPEKTQGGSPTINRTLYVNQLAEGVSILSPTTVSQSTTETGPFAANILFVTIVDIPVTLTGLQILNIIWNRDAGTYNHKVRNVIFGVKFLI